MKPTWERDGIQLYLGDCMDVLPHLPKVDAVVTDPPYGETSLEWDRLSNDWLPPMVLSLKENGAIWICGSFRSLSSIDFERFDLKFGQDLIWEKHNGSNFHNDRFRRVHELLIHVYRGRWSDITKNVVTTPDATKRTVRRKQRPTHLGQIGAGEYQSTDGGPRLMRSVLQVRSCHGVALHPTQKPIGLLVPLIEYSSNPGEFIADPFMGSGSSGVAAIKVARKFIGIEKEPKYFEIAVKRIERALSEERSSLFPAAKELQTELFRKDPIR